MDNESGAFETRSDAGEGDEGAVKLWLDALDISSKEESEWRKRAQKVIERYRDEKERGGNKFNILRSNVKTMRPAIYNSIPVPDIRRRFADQDPAARFASQTLERCVSYGMDDGSVDGEDLDDILLYCVNDMLLPGRGWAYCEYTPTLGMVQQQTGVDEFGQPVFEEVEQVVDEEIVERHVQWDDFRRGPGKTWGQVPWVAVRHYMTRDELVEKFPDCGEDVTLDASVRSGDYRDDGAPDSDLFKRATVWQIWDKPQREVLFIAPSYKKKPLSVDKDPLRLRGFFPGPKPLYANIDSSSLVPVEDFREYKDQADELDNLTSRINGVISVLKWRGVYDATIREMADLERAKDGELVPAQDILAIMQSGGLDNAIWLMPIDKAAAVLNQLYVAREQVKQTIYEITGVSDILRGATDPNETLGAQQIKAQFGSGKLQERQKAVAKFARGLIRIRAEIVAEHYQPDMQAAQSSVPEAVLPQVQELLRSDQLRGYRVDIETDSTTAADMTMAKQNIGEFVQGFGQFMQAVAPAVQSGAMPKDVAIDLLSSFQRAFKLGKGAEDALERWSQSAQPQPGQEGQQPQQPSPEDQKAAMEAQAAQADIQAKAQKAQMDAQTAQAKAQADMLKAQLDAQKAQMESEIMVKTHQENMRNLEIAALEREAAHAVKMRSMSLDIEESENETEVS